MAKKKRRNPFEEPIELDTEVSAEEILRQPREDLIDLDPVPAPRPIPKTRYNANAYSPFKNSNGTYIRGRNEVDPASIQHPPKPPLSVGAEARAFVLVVEQSRDRRTYRHRVVNVSDSSVLSGLGDVAYDSGVLDGGAKAMGLRKVLHVFTGVMRKAMNVPGTV